jgi:hypothetical protein
MVGRSPSEERRSLRGSRPASPRKDSLNPETPKALNIHFPIADTHPEPAAIKAHTRCSLANLSMGQRTPGA